MTCACGEQDKELQAGGWNGSPWDTLLVELGLRFQQAVVGNEVQEALYELERIQLRARYLLHLLHVDKVERDIIMETHHLNQWTEEAEVMMWKVLSQTT